MNTEDSDNGSKLQECIKREIEILDQLEKIHELHLSKIEEVELESKLRLELLETQQVIFKNNHITEELRRILSEIKINEDEQKPEKIHPKINCSQNISDVWMKRIRAVDEAGNAGPLKGGKGKL
jgi:hypothetical protein